MDRNCSMSECIKQPYPENSRPINDNQFYHRTLEERVKDFGGKLGPYRETDWGTAQGREIW